MLLPTSQLRPSSFATSGGLIHNDKNSGSTSFPKTPYDVGNKGWNGQLRPKWKCRECGRTCNSDSSLRSHRRSHTLSCKCGFCGKVPARKRHLQGHAHTHLGEKPFVCPACHHASADCSHLQAHLQTHIEVKRWRCLSCTALFSWRLLLNLHPAMCLFSTTATVITTTDVRTTYPVNTTYDVDTITSAN